jgi:hypothetical protein
MNTSTILLKTYDFEEDKEEIQGQLEKNRI